MRKRVYDIEFYHNGRGGNLCVDVDQACTDTAFLYNGLHLPGDVNQYIMGRGY